MRTRSLSRIFIADDHAIVREGLSRVLAARGFTVVGEAAHGGEALTRLETTPCDVLVLDLSLPRINGLEVIRRVRERWPEVAIVVHSMYPSSQYAARVIEAGARAYVSKQESVEALLSALDRVLRGDGATGDRRAIERAQAPHERLSAREYQVFVLLTQGRTPGEIAAELQSSPSSVSNMLARIRAKLSVESNAEVLQYALRERFIASDCPTTTPE